MKRLWTVAVIAAHLSALNADTERPRTMGGNRFLFVVETSASSSRLDHGGRQALVDLIYTGLYGQMRTGDTFGVWAFNEQVFAGVYPMQTWDSENTMELASNAGQFLKGRLYRKKGRFEPVVQDVLSLIRGVKDVNVFIISDAETRPPADAFGLAFDREYAETIAKLPNSKTPLITTIVGHNGSISNWFVTVGGEPIRLPAFAVPPHVAPKPANPVTVAKVEAPRPKRSPIIMKGSSAPGTGVTVENNSGSQPKLGQVISSSAQISFVSSSQTNAFPATATPPGGAGRAIDSKTASTSPSAANQAPAVAMETNPGKASDGPRPLPAVSQPPLVKSEPPKEAVVKTAPPPPRNEQPRAIAGASATQPPVPPSRVEAPAVARAPLLGPEPLKVAARERTKSSETNLAQGQHPITVGTISEPTFTDRLFSPAAMVVIGGLLLILAAALGLIFWQRARRPAQPSFITQSLER